MTHVPPWIGAMALAARPTGGAPPGPAWKPTVRPATIALAADLTLGGNSLANGNGAVAGQRMADYLATMLTAGAVLPVWQAGMAFNIPAAPPNTNPIPDQILNQGAAGLANNDQGYDGGLNCYNVGVVPLPGRQFWTANATNGLSVLAGGLTGGAPQLNTFWGGTPEETSGPGMIRWADWVFLKRSLTPTRGPDMFDLGRLLQSFCDPNPATLDYINVNTFRGLPYTFRGMDASLQSFPSTPQTVLNTASVTPNTAVQMNLSVPPGPFAIGDYIQNNHPNALANNIYRKGNLGTWERMDEKHGSGYYYNQWAIGQFDILAAKQGDGAPYAAPAEMYYPQDVAAGVVVGTLYYYGPAPAVIGLYDASQALDARFTLTDNGSANNRGSITVRRSAVGVLTEGYELLDLQTEDGSGFVQHSVVDAYTGQPSTQTTPRAWMLPGAAGPNTPAANCTFYGRTAHSLADGAQFNLSGWILCSDFADAPYIYDLGPDNGSVSYLRLNLTTTGRFRVTALNAAGALVVNNQAALASAIPLNTWVWYSIDIDVSTPLATVTGYLNIAGSGVDTNMAFGAGPAAATTLEGSKFSPRFLALRDASLTYQGYVDTVRKQLRGGVGNLIVCNGLVGVATPANRALLWDPVTGQPTPRVPFSAINGAVVRFDIQGGIGDLAWGGFDPSQPVMGTWLNILSLT